MHVQTSTVLWTAAPGAARLLVLVALTLAGANPARGQASFINFESAPVHPADITPDGTRLLVTNAADNRLEVFTLGAGLPVWAASIPVGLEPVSVRVRSNTEAWVVNTVSDTVSVVDLSVQNVSRTLAVGDEPSDVVFAGSPLRAFVSVSGLNRVLVLDPANPAAPAVVVPIAGHRPKALATDGTRVFAAVFFAGNRSTVLAAPVVSAPGGPAGGVNPPSNTAGPAFIPALAPGLPPPPAVGLIVNREITPQGEKWKDDAGRFWDASVPWQLNQNAVAVIDGASLATTYIRNIGNIQMALAVQPGTGKIAVTQVYLRNEARFESVARAQFARQRIAIFDPVNPNSGTIQDLNPHLMVSPPQATYKANPTPAEKAMSIGDPRAIVWKVDGSAAYIAGMGSNSVAKIVPGTGLPVPTRLATIPVGQGPVGLALDTARSRLYVVNRFDATVSVINTATDAELGRVGYFDPTPAVIKAGRPLHYGTQAFSLLGQASCNSCHIDGRTDMQPWDLGDPAGAVKPFNQTCDSGACNDWHPMKGPFMTQTLQGIIGSGPPSPMHWRGDREDITAFTVGYTGLLGAAAPPSIAQMNQLGAFYATLAFAPQPNRTFTDGLPGSVAGLTGNPAAGAALFAGAPLFGAASSCTQCHSAPSGSGTTIIPGAALGQSQGLKTPPLRTLYTNTGFDKASQSSNRGFGFGHEGAADTPFSFLQGHTVTYPATAAGDQARRDLEAFLVCFPSGTHPAIGVQQTITAATKSDPTLIAQIASMTALADTGAVGLIAKGKAAGLARGYVYLAGTGTAQADRFAETPTIDALRLAVTAGSELTFTVVPAGTPTRAGIDRDGDGYFDRDEVDAGSDPADPASVPPVACRPSISQQPPGSVSGRVGGSLMLSVGSLGAVQQHWRKNGVNLADSASVSGSAASTLTLNPLSLGDAGTYDEVLTNGCGSTTSTSTVLSVFCRADFNQSGGPATVQDLFDFLAAWFAKGPGSDFNGSGQVTVQDLFDFLAAWLGGC